MFVYYLVLVRVVLGFIFSQSETTTCNSGSEVEIKNLGTYLVDLDAKILRMLVLPEKGHGDEFIENLESFWRNYRRLDGLVVLSDQAAFRPAKYLLEQECPKFIHEAFDVYNLQQTYEWDGTKFASFREYIILVAGLSTKFQDDFSKMRVDVETLFEKPMEQ